MRFSLLVPSFLLLAVFSLSMISEIYAEDTEQNLGDYKIINIADVPHLQDEKGFFIFPAFCPTACSVSWVKSEAPPTTSVEPQAPATDNATTSANSTNDNTTAASLNNTATYAPQGEDESFNEEYLIGAIKVEFTKAGVYSFSYFIKPILGDFQDLTALQVITLPADGDKGYVPLSQVSWNKYPYTMLGKSTFRIDKPGVYFVGFGPAQGTALTKLEAEGIPSGFTLKYKLDPLENVKILKPDMNIYIKQVGQGISYEAMGYQELAKSAALSQAQEFSLTGIRNAGVPDENVDGLLMRGISNTLIGGADLRYPLGRNADFAVLRINEFKPILHEVFSNGDMETAQITTAKILTYLTVLVDEAKNSGGYTPTIQGKFTQAMNMWLDENYEGVLPIAAEISKDLLPLIHSEWQQRPSFSVYMLNAKAVDADSVPLSLAGLPVTVSFENGGLERVVKTNDYGETVFIGPSGKFGVYSIYTAKSSDGGMTKIKLLMDAKTGKWFVDATAFQSPISIVTK
ncbi:MAG: hypothetical protein WAL46_08470 [Nitrososphaeraceae archaeon]